MQEPSCLQRSTDPEAASIQILLQIKLHTFLTSSIHYVVINCIQVHGFSLSDLGELSQAGYAIAYTGWYMLISSLSTVLANTYNLSTLKIGLVYLAPGAGSAIGAFVNGRVLDRDYQRIKAKHSGTSTSEKLDGNTTEEKLGDFPLERARLQSFPFLVTGYICSTIAYGFLVRYEVHIAGPIIFNFFSTYCQQGIMSTFGTMCVDYKPSKGASATSLNNIFKCLLGAAGTAVIQPMINGIGTGFTYLIVSGLVSLTSFLVIRLSQSAAGVIKSSRPQRSQLRAMHDSRLGLLMSNWKRSLSQQSYLKGALAPLSNFSYPNVLLLNLHSHKISAFNATSQTLAQMSSLSSNSSSLSLSSTVVDSSSSYVLENAKSHGVIVAELLNKYGYSGFGMAPTPVPASSKPKKEKVHKEKNVKFSSSKDRNQAKVANEFIATYGLNDSSAPTPLPKFSNASKSPHTFWRKLFSTRDT